MEWTRKLSIWITVFFVCVLLHPPCVTVSTVELDSEVASERIRLGKEKYEALQKNAQAPRYSQCWTGALRNLEFGCKRLTDDIQHRLALEFANCYLLKTGREAHPCSPSQDVTECTKNMPQTAYLVYTEFFTQTQNICFFLHSQIWQENTEQTIGKLADTSNVVAHQLENSSTLQMDLISKQNESIKNQETMMRSGLELKKTLEESSIDIHRMLKDFKDATTEQKNMIFEVFDRVNSLRNMVMGEFTGFYSIIFYTTAFLICYVLTSTPQTSGSRFYLFAILTMSFVVERTVVTIGQCDDYTVEGLLIDGATVVYQRLWICRKVSCILAIVLWGWSAYRYKDINRINNALLEDIKSQNLELKTMFQTSVLRSSSNGLDSSSTSLVPVQKDQVAPPVAPWRNLFNTTRDTPDRSFNETGHEEESESDVESNNSLDSKMSDRTFQVPGSEEDSDSDQSFMAGDSSRYSRNSTSLLEEVRCLRESTPMKEFMKDCLFITNSPDLNDNGSRENTPTPRKRGRPKGSKSKPKTPVDLNSSQSRYNLRRRGQSIENQSVASESPDTFGRYVKHLADVAIRSNTSATVLQDPWTDQLMPVSVMMGWWCVDDW